MSVRLLPCGGCDGAPVAGRLLAMVVPLVTILAAHAAEPAAAVKPAQPDPAKFLWGFCQVGHPDDWPLGDEEMQRTVDDLGINAVRIFVHPRALGFPQQTWTGRESIDYIRTAPKEIRWHNPSPKLDSFDELITWFRKFKIHPVLMIFPVDEYVTYIYKDDLSGRNDPKHVDHGRPLPLDYTGIRPLEQVIFLSRLVARHVHERFGDDFTINFTEVLGSNRDPHAAHAGERERWKQVVAAIHAEAPGCRVASPELCVGLWWFPTAQANDGNVAGKDILYNDQWPRGDKIENYASAFDEVCISYSCLGINEWLISANSRTHLRASCDVVQFVTRDHSLPKRWLWGEAPWGSTAQPHEFHAAWAPVFFGCDNCAGLLSWCLKAYQGAGPGAIEKDGKLSATYPLLKQFARVICEEAEFFAAHHKDVNADGFAVARKDLLVEDDSQVMTRLLGRHLAVFNCGGRRGDVVLRGCDGCRLESAVKLGWPFSEVGIAYDKDTIRLSNLVPGHLYLLRLIR